MPPVSISVKRAPVPLAGDLVAVAGDAGALVDDGRARARQAVDERGLADVRVADDRDLRCSCACAHQADDARDDLVDASGRWCRADRRPGAATMRRRARGPSRARRARAATASTSTPAPRRGGARAPRGVEADLHLGVGRHDRADVAALGDPVAGGDQGALLGDERGADRGVGRRAARRSWLISGVRIASVTSAPSRSTRSPSKRMSSVAGSRSPASADAAVHRPGVEVGEAQRARGGAGDGGLAGPRGAVDGDEHGEATLARASLLSLAPMTQFADNEYLFTSESVTEGHPDKVADQISDGVLDACLTDDPRSRVACETLVNTGLVVVSGEISTETYVDIQESCARPSARSATSTPTSASAPTPAPSSTRSTSSRPTSPRASTTPTRRAPPQRRRRARRRRRRRPGDDVRLRLQRDARADAAADLARAPAGQQLADGPQGRRPRLPAPRRQDPGVRALPRWQAGRDREAPDLHPARRGRRVADPGRPLGERRPAGARRRHVRRREAAQASSWSTRPGAS